MSTIEQEIGRKNVTHIRKAVAPDGMSITDTVFFAVPYGEDANNNGWKTAKEVSASLGPRLRSTQVHPAMSALAEEGSIVGRPRNGKRPWEYRRVFKSKRKLPSGTSRKVTKASPAKPKHEVSPIQTIEEAMAQIENALTLLRQQQVILDNLQKVLNP